MATRNAFAAAFGDDLDTNDGDSTTKSNSPGVKSGSGSAKN